jgi:hypothetical protein
MGREHHDAVKKRQKWRADQRRALKCHYYTPPQKFGQDFAPSHMKNTTMRQFCWIFCVILGNALMPKVDCPDTYGGRNRALPDLRTWGYRARIRGARSFKQSPCRVLDEKSNGLKAPQHEWLCDGRANIMQRRRRGGVGQVAVGKAHEIAYAQHQYAHNQRKLRSVSML